jgi:hypothetical protein
MPNLYYFQIQEVIFMMDILLIRKFFESKAEDIDLIPVAHSTGREPALKSGRLG